MNLLQKIINTIERVRNDYYQLILIVGMNVSEIEQVLVELSKEKSWPLTNINLELSKQLIDLSPEQRVFKTSEILDQVLNKYSNEVVILTKIDILFNVELQQDPLKLLKMFSRKKILIANWAGIQSNDSISYAESGHPDYRRYNNPEVVTLSYD